MVVNGEQGGAPELVLLIDGDADAHIRGHAREAYPNECCGALIGYGNVVSEVFSLPNTTEEGPRRRFLVRPSDYRAADQRAADSGGELLGFLSLPPGSPGEAVPV